MRADSVLIYCNCCRAKVQLEVYGSSSSLYTNAGQTDKVTGGRKASVGRCAACRSLLVGVQQLTEYDDDAFDTSAETWSDAERVWPEPESALSLAIPGTIRESLAEAYTCLNSGAHTASVAMSGRALEAVGRHFTTGDPEKLLLAAGLRELHETKVIDDRLYLWGEELHEHRNLAAHASGAKFSRIDAEDLLNFAVAICEYLFVVQEKYDVFIRRKNNRKTGNGDAKH